MISMNMIWDHFPYRMFESVSIPLGCNKYCSRMYSVLFPGLVLYSPFQIHRFINHLFAFSIVLQKNRMMQIPSCEPAFTALQP